METKFKRVHTPKNIITSIVVLAAGIGLYFVQAALGIFLIICGILMLLFFKSGYKKVGDGNTVLTKMSMDVASEYRQSIIDFLNGMDVEPVINKKGLGGIDLLEIYFNRETGVAYAQLFVFSNYQYKPETEIFELHKPQSDKLISQL